MPSQAQRTPVHDQPGSWPTGTVRAVNDHPTRLRLEQGASAFNRVRDALRRLQSVTTADQLFDRGAEAICSLGFDHGLVSRIDDGNWVIESTCGPDDPGSIDELCALARDYPQPLHAALYETELVRRKQPIMVSDASGSSAHPHNVLGVHSGGRSYVAAPIMSEHEVIGFLHADCYYQNRDVDELDRDILAMFAEGFGAILHRTMLMEHLDSLHRDLSLFTGRVSAIAAGALPRRTEPEGRLHAVPEVSSQHVGSRAKTAALTGRERDILRLVAGGDTNIQVARRLVVSEGTVKWHIKNILRKLGAPNRAAAVSYWLAAQQS